MSDNPDLVDPVIEGVWPIPYSEITCAIVAWNEEARLPALLAHLRPYFNKLAVGVQKGTDRSAEIAAEWADILVYDDHHGFGDATFGPRLLPQVMTTWTFKVDCDEWPDEDLLDTLGQAVAYAEDHDYEGVWVPFHSAVEGQEYEEQHSHLRLFRTSLGWPAMLHSRPPAERSMLWNVGYVRHDRSLDEMMQDYLRYWHIGRGNDGWETHNRAMLAGACASSAAAKGWDFVQSFPWWPEVEAIAFADEKPWLVQV